MKKNIIGVLEECIVSINSGESVEDCLKLHPEHAEELGELLQTAKTLSVFSVENIPVESKERSRALLLTRLKSLSPSSRKYKETSIRNEVINKIWLLRQSLISLKPAAGRLLVVLGITGLFLLLSGGLLITSAKSLPGDSLYPVKMAVEDIKFRLASNVETRHEIESRYTKQRVEEVKNLLEIGRSQQVSFEGVVISIGDSDWNVGGIPVEVKPDTIIVGGIGGTKEIEPGMVIEIEGRTNPNGWVDADELHIREYQFIGSVDKISASYWLISGIKVNISTTVRIDRAIKAGDDVFVNVHSEDSGLYAISILRVNHATVTPTQIPSTIVSSTEEDNDITENKVINYAQGIVEEIKAHYWVVNGEIYFIVPDTELDSEINTGNVVSIEYIIENNGSFTAIKIESKDSNDELDGDEQATPHPTDIGDGEATSEVTETEEHEDGEHTPEPSETPKPSETPEPDH